jgi:hypothetical protein
MAKNERMGSDRVAEVAGSFRRASMLHREAFERKTIRDTVIVARIVSALGLTPPIKASIPIAKLLGGNANAWDIALLLMAYSSFKRDGLVLQKGDVMDADTLGDLGDLVFAWYVSEGWKIA